MVAGVLVPMRLGPVYFMVVTPLSLLMRLAGRNPLRRPLREGSYWAAAPSGGRSDLDNQF